MFFLFQVISPLSGSVCLHMGEDCTHGERCPVMAKDIETVVCHTGHTEGHGEAHAPESLRCGMYLGNDVAGPGALSPLDMPYLAGKTLAPGPDHSVAPVTHTRSFFADPFAAASEEPPEASLVS
ncbi:MAG: hypothetical protein QY316_12560 [Thermodesulfobacteriota bacterium]|nr:MAG: hypothetical protein QY316_12560 [Thermodesulfobacteriota bacterium]